MITGEARKGRWSVFTDVIYLDFSDDDSKVKSIDFIDGGPDRVSASLDAGTETSFKGLAWTLAGSYGVLQGDLGRLELLAGLRCYDMDDDGLVQDMSFGGPEIGFKIKF
jgi:hypothetical protein